MADKAGGDHERPGGFWRTLWHRKWIVVVAVVATTSTVLVGNRVVTPRYEAITTLRLKEQPFPVLGIDLTSSDVTDINSEGEVRTQVEILKSRSVRQRVVEQLGLANRPAGMEGGGEARGMQLAVDALEAAISVTPVATTRLIRVAVRGTDPGLAMRIANAVAQAAMDRDVESRRGEARAVLDFVTGQADEVSRRLEIAEGDLLRYRQAHRVVSLDDQTRRKLDRLSDLEVSYQEVLLERGILATRIAAVQATAGPGAAPSANQVIRVQIAGYRSRDAELASQQQTLEGIIGAHEREIDSLSPLEKRLARLERDLRIQDGLYSALVQAGNAAQVEAASRISGIDVIDRAVIPALPVTPKRQENILVGIVLGALLGLCFAFMAESFDHSVRTEEEARSLLAAPLLGFVPTFPRDGRGAGGATGARAGRSFSLPARDENGSAASEAFRHLRTGLSFAGIDDGLSTILVTSSIPGEGKTTIAANLAISLAAAEEKVLIIDADLRAPAVHRVFGLPQSPGLTSALAGRADYRDFVRTLPGVPRVEVMTSGPLPPNPGEVIGSSRMKELVRQVRRDFDRVIFDAPPVLGATEATVLASLVDGAVMVLSMGMMDRRTIGRSMEILGAARAVVVGGVLNRVRPAPRRSGRRSGRRSARATAASARPG